MENKYNKVLTVCSEQAKKSGGNLNVFDITYETSLAYPELKEILDRLVLNNELEVIDIKTYKFTGDINRKAEEAKPEEIIIDDPLEAKRAYLERRRKEIIEMMQKEKEEDPFAEDDGCILYDDSVNSDEPEAGQTEKLTSFMKSFLREARITKSWEEIPEHPSWDNENDFMRFCAEKLIEIANSDKKAGRLGALKKAKVILEGTQKTKSKKIIEVYECIVFELGNMSNYYYIKIRDGLL